MLNIFSNQAANIPFKQNAFSGVRNNAQRIALFNLSYGLAKSFLTVI